jgi:hypothetical protein
VRLEAAADVEGDGMARGLPEFLARRDDALY